MGTREELFEYDRTQEPVSIRDTSIWFAFRRIRFEYFYGKNVPKSTKRKLEYFCNILKKYHDHDTIVSAVEMLYFYTDRFTL